MSRRVGLSADRLATLAEIETTHFWFAGRRILVDRLLDRHLDRSSRLILDVGCGTGWMARHVSQRGGFVVGVDVRPVRTREPRGGRGPQFIQADATLLPLRGETFDAVLALDVLEHVDDRLVLRELHRVLRPRGVAVITVPALPWLWSYRDRAAGHLRRYTRRHFLDVVTWAGFQAREIRSYQFLLLPAILISRLAGRQRPVWRDLEDRPGPLLNMLLAWMTALEVKLGDRVAWPWGLSLAAVLRKTVA